jgi:CHAT domain-containing protein/tetratricopeptide (TPR) repeat protein
MRSLVVRALAAVCLLAAPTACAVPRTLPGSWAPATTGFNLPIAPSGFLRPAASPTEAPPASAPPTADEIRGLLRSGDYAGAEHAARRLLAHVEQLHGENSLKTAEALDLLANAMRMAGKAGDPETREVGERAVRIKERLIGPDSLGTATSLTELGLLFAERGQLEEARRVLTRVLGIRERTLGPEDALVASSLKFLAAVENQAGSDSLAEPLLQRAIRIERATRSPKDPVLGQSLNMLASLAFNEGDYARAGPLYEEVLEIYRDAYGPDHPNLSTPLHNLGAVYAELGDPVQALRYLKKALDLRVRALGADHWLVASTLGNLGSVLEDLGDIPGARARLEEALAIQERVRGMEHAEVAWTLTHLGRLDVRAGRYSSAKTRLTRALDIQEKLLGPRHPDLCWTLGALASTQEAEHDLAAARHSYERAVAIPEDAYGPSNPDRIRALNDYAAFLARTADSTRALDMALRSADARASQLRTVTRGLAEQQALTYVSFGTAGLDLAVELTARGVEGPTGVRRAWDAVIRSRTLVLDEMAARQQIVATARADSGLAATIRVVDEARRRYAALLVRGVRDRDVKQFRENLERAQESVGRAERSLAAASQPFRTEEARSRIGLNDVVAALPTDAALVSFAVCDTGAAESYVAFVKRFGIEPCEVPLGHAAAIDPLIDRWIRAIASAPAKDRGATARRAEASCRRRGDVLRRKIWDPVAACLGAASRVFIVPDGDLYRINFAALPVGSSEYLAGSGPLLHGLTSERDLVPAAPERGEGTGLLALGGPMFDRQIGDAGMPESSHRRGIAPDAVPAAPATAPATAARPSPAGASAARPSAAEDRGWLPDCPDFQDVRFEPLPGSVGEVEEIAGLWPDAASIVLLTGTDASEPELRRFAHGQRVLHLATHGFFLDRAHCMVARGRRGIGGLSGKSEPEARRVPDRIVPARPAGNPLRLSGLALAGANLRGKAASGDVDGILTAEEVASLDLAGTEWAVLSACDTGVGRVQIREGVLGLRRAFRVAGARTVIMSLWEVDDQATRRWMKVLYEARFQQHLGTAEAVREASLSVLRERRAQTRSTHPFFWAGFVAAGDWR